MFEKINKEILKLNQNNITLSNVELYQNLELDEG